jgi:UDPglucose 6-dehydrogenase
LYVAVIGSGYVGLVTGACLASLGHYVNCLDVDRDRIARLRAGELPIYETGLDDFFREQVLTGRLRFTHDYGEALAEAEVAFICVGTPPLPDGQADTTAVRSAAQSIGSQLRKGFTVVVNKSTVPIGSGDLVGLMIRRGLEKRPAEEATGCDWEVVSNPEFLREGSAIADTLLPDRIVLGADSQRSLDVMQELYSPILAYALERGKKVPVLLTDRVSAEMIKYACNAFLATKISFINEISQICEVIGADVAQVADGIGMDHRIGRAFLNAGIGWGGSCFPKDLSALIHLAQAYGHQPHLLQAAKSVNQYQREHAVRLLQRRLKVLNGKTVGLWGLAFKPGTDDLREAPAVEIARQLSSMGAWVRAYDPVCAERARREGLAVELVPDAYAAARRADAVILVTEWPEFRELEWARLAAEMPRPLVIDGRNFLDGAALRAAGIDYCGIGK